MTKTGSENWITSYPANLSLRHLAETFEDKQRERKLREKQQAFAIQNEELFKIKTQCRNVYFDVETENIYTTCNVCCTSKKKPAVVNYCADVLDASQLLWLRSPGNTRFVYPKLLLTINERCSDCAWNVSKSEELIHFLDQYSLECEKVKHKHYNEYITRKTLQKWMKKVASGFAYVFSSVTFKIIGFCWYFLSHRFMQRLIVSSAEVEEIKMSRDPIPVLYIIKNQTKFDWFMVLFVLFFLKLKPPIVFLPKHLKPRFSWVYRKLGVSFLNLPSDAKTVKSTVYEEFWYIYVEENFKMGNHLMFYMDTKTDVNGGDFVLESAVDSLKRNAVSDIYIAPVSINYDRKIDSVTKKKWSKMSTWSICWDVLKKKVFNFGFVKIAFIHPYSLTGMLLNVGTKDEIAPYDATKVLYDPASFSLTCKVSQHLAFDFCRSEIIMSTNLISFLLLKKFRGGIRLDDFVEEVNEFRSILKSTNTRVGFTGSSKNVIMHAVELLGCELVKIESNDTSIIKPILELPHVVDLSSYSDVILRRFMFDAILFKSIASIFKNSLEEAFQSGQKELKFFYLDLMEEVMNLCDILQTEYIFEKPCQKIDVEFEDVFFKYVSCSYFVKIEKMFIEEENWARRYAKHLETDSESEYDEEDDYYVTRRGPVDRGDEYLINYEAEKSVLKDILFYQNCLKPITDAYVVSAESLKILIEKQMRDSVYYNYVICRMQKMFFDKSLEYPESISVSTIRNSMNLFRNWNVIEIYVRDGIKLFSLTAAFETAESLANVVQKIKEFQ